METESLNLFKDEPDRSLEFWRVVNYREQARKQKKNFVGLAAFGEGTKSLASDSG